jgi:hypothetical protein
MKPIIALAAVAILASTAASADARNLPREMLGAWCPVEVPLADYNIFERAAKCQANDRLVMEPDGSLRGHEYRFSSIAVGDSFMGSQAVERKCRFPLGNRKHH